MTWPEAIVKVAEAVAPVAAFLGFFVFLGYLVKKAP